jgi:hypothetical protein
MNYKIITMDYFISGLSPDQADDIAAAMFLD